MDVSSIEKLLNTELKSILLVTVKYSACLLTSLILGVALRKVVPNLDCVEKNRINLV